LGEGVHVHSGLQLGLRRAQAFQRRERFLQLPSHICGIEGEPSPVA
jgi:hypothetical protein